MVRYKKISGNHFIRFDMAKVPYNRRNHNLQEYSKIIKRIKKLYVKIYFKDKVRKQLQYTPKSIQLQ